MRKNLFKKVLCFTIALLMLMPSMPGNMVSAEAVPGENGVVTMTAFPDTSAPGYNIEDYPGFGSQGHVRMTKSAKWVDRNNGIAEVSFHVNGTPVKQGVDAILVIDRSGSMGGGSYAIDSICVNPNHTTCNGSITWVDDGAQTYSDSGSGNTRTRTYRQNVTGTCDNCGSTYNSYKTRTVTIKRVDKWSPWVEQGNWSSWTVPQPTVCTAHLNESGNPIAEGGLGSGCTMVSTRMEVAKQAARNFVNTMFANDDDGEASLHRVGLVSFNSGVNASYNSPLTGVSGKSNIETNINDLQADGGTNYDDALQAAINMLNGRTGSDRNRPAYIVFLTDGMPDPWYLDGEEQADTLKGSSYNATIYSIGLMMSQYYYDNLKYIASDPDDKYFYPVTDPSRLGSVFSSIADNTKVAGTGASVEDAIQTINFNGTVISAEASTGASSISYPNSGSVNWQIGEITKGGAKLTVRIKMHDSILQDPNARGLYDTNAGPATLRYTNFLGHGCVQKVETPRLPRNACSINIVYYLVNDQGLPISTGIPGTVDWENKEVLKNITYNDGISNLLLPNHLYSVSADIPTFTADDGTVYSYVPESAGNGGNPTTDDSPVEVSFSEDGQSATVYFGYKETEDVTVIFDKNHTDVTGWTEANPTSKDIVKYSNVGTLPTPPTRAGYTFNGWNTQADGKGDVFTADTQVTNNITVHAQWEAKTDVSYTVEYETAGGTKLLPDKPVTGKTFGQTYDENAEDIPGYTADAASKTITLDAYGKVLTFVYTEGESVTITYEAGTGGTGGTGGTVSRASESLAPATGVATGSTATAITGYHFVNWTVKGTETVAGTNEVLSATEVDAIAKASGIYVATTFVANFEEDVEEMIELNVHKYWYDSEAQQQEMSALGEHESVRPDRIKVHLLNEDGESVAFIEIEPDEDGDWFGSFTVPMYDEDNNEIDYSGYTVEEETLDGYITEVENWGGDGFGIYNIEAINVPVTKVWEGPEGDEVTVEMVGPGGLGTGFEVTLSDDNNWKDSFKLPKYENIEGIREIDYTEYTVSELEVEGYSTEVTGNVNDGFVVTNRAVDVEYTVNYWEVGNDVPMETVTKNGTYGSKVTEVAKDFPGYKVDETTKSIKELGITGTEINFYYTKEEPGQYYVEINVEHYIQTGIDAYVKDGETVSYTKDVTITSGTAIGGTVRGVEYKKNIEGYIYKESRPGSIDIEINITSGSAITTGSAIKTYTFKLYYDKESVDENNPPAVVNDSYSVDEDKTLTIPAPGVLSNDTDGDNDSLTAVLVEGPRHGTLTLNPDGSFTYTPNADFNGTDSFTYKAYDGTSYSTTATVTITVNPVDDGGGGGGGTTIPETPPPLAELEKTDHFAYVIGYPEGDVRPLNNITREEVAMIFYRLLTDESRNALLSDVNPFTDLEGHDWSNRAISTLYNAGILAGYPDGTFRPSDPISRAEFATIAAKFDKLELQNTTKFTDISGHWAEKYITSSEVKGWIKGYPDLTFKPEQDITRAEAMTLINNVLERSVPEENIHPDAIFWPDMTSDDWYYEAVMEATNSHDYIYEEDGDELWTGMKANKVWP